ncbi:ComEC/Rec2 family competence protein [Paenibacillus sp. 19GGS1-52]|nr:ComEC/Rec2 family competence protein [Paenibacillus sp. 19GGS1-52]ULO10252.1 ComEC/Rec2 family competence protein [Paenibacillus sp. 19GGS1-52]
MWVWAGLLLLLTIFAICGKLSWKYMMVLGLAILLAGFYWEWNEGRNLSSLPVALSHTTAELNKASIQAVGVIISSVERDGDRVDFTVKLSQLALASADKQQLKGQGELIAVQVKLQVEEEIAVAAQWQRGDQVLLSGVLEQPAVARNFGGFDYREYLHMKKIHWLLKLEGTASVEATPPSIWSPRMLLRWNDQARFALGAELDHLFEKRHSGYMKGLVIGLQDDLDPETFQQFSQLGLTHILAISGMHVAVYVGVLLFIWRRCRLTRETALTLTLVLVPLYVLLSGAGPSVVRAGLMSMIALLAARLGVLGDGLNILGASALVMLIWNPYLLLSVSFQLSFLVTAGLMVFVPLAEPLLRGLPRVLRSAVSVTLVAQFVSFPLTIYYFNQFSLLSFAANLVLVPFITFIVLPLGTLALLCGRVWDPGARLLAHVTELLNNATFSAVEWINSFSSGVMIWRSPSLLWIAAYYVLFYGLLYAAKLRTEARYAPQYMEDETKPLEGLSLPNGRNSGIREVKHRYSIQARTTVRWSGMVVLMCALSLGILLYRGYQSENLSGAGSISYLDVGQGDSMLITTPEGAHILVDGGGTVSFGGKEAWRIRHSPFEVGAKVLVPLLKKRGIHRLDAIILTHGDQDHAGGLQAVLEGIPVSALLFNGTIADREPYKLLMSTALAANVRLYGVYQGMSLAPDGATELSFLWPEPPELPTPASEESELPTVEDQNHESVAFRLVMNGRSFLFTGDMDQDAEESIMQNAKLNGIHSGPQIDVLKAAHHGSKTATGEGWLKFWMPTAAVISAGVNNSYGHPNSAVLDRLEANNTAIFRTDLQGEIQMRVREQAITVRYKLR